MNSNPARNQITKKELSELTQNDPSTNPFFNFLSEERSRICADLALRNENFSPLDFARLTKQCIELWNSFTREQKVPYKLKADKAKQELKIKAEMKAKEKAKQLAKKIKPKVLPKVVTRRTPIKDKETNATVAAETQTTPEIAKKPKSKPKSPGKAQTKKAPIKKKKTKAPVTTAGSKGKGQKMRCERIKLSQKATN